MSGPRRCTTTCRRWWWHSCSISSRSPSTSPSSFAFASRPPHARSPAPTHMVHAPPSSLSPSGISLSSPAPYAGTSTLRAESSPPASRFTTPCNSSSRRCAPRRSPKTRFRSRPTLSTSPPNHPPTHPHRTPPHWLQVATLCVGQACSMGSLLLAGGAPGMRRALPNSRVMIHQPSGGVSGQARRTRSTYYTTTIYSNDI